MVVDGEAVTSFRRDGFVVVPDVLTGEQIAAGRRLVVRWAWRGWPRRPGGPYVGGLTPGEADGRPGTFTMLAGVWLTDHRQENHGNLWLWPGTHVRFGQYLAERGAVPQDRTG